MIRAREAKMTIFRPYFLKSLKSLKMERAEGARALKPPFEAPDPPNPQKFSNLRAPQNPRGTPSQALLHLARDAHGLETRMGPGQADAHHG